jgi:hypothetical protein
MGAYAASSTHHNAEFGFSGVVRFCKQILNAFAERAAVAADRSRFAALPARHLDDIGMTASERAAVLGYDESTIDPWRVLASHL